MSRSILLERSQGFKVFLRIWDEVENPKAVVQIFHGMAEHSERYDDFAKYLNSKGYIVYADDHRGHGHSVKTGTVKGYIGENGFNNIVEDEKEISNMIRKNHKGLPLYVFAHSFGSFIGQEYITRYSSEIDGIILSGSCKQDGIDIKLGKIVASIQKSLFNEASEGKLIDKLSFGAFNSKVKDRKTNCDWLSRDNNEVQKYLNDEFCGFVSPINFYHNMFNGLSQLYNEDKLNKIDKNLSILVLSGDEDPVGKYGKGVLRLHDQYSKLGIKNASVKLYEGGRHELLNETNKEEVYDFVYNWIDESLKLNA